MSNVIDFEIAGFKRLIEKDHYIDRKKKIMLNNIKILENAGLQDAADKTFKDMMKR